MHTKAIDIRCMPASDQVIDELRKCFSQDDIDLRDITALANQDAIVLANILFLVNEIFLKRNSPVVNTLSAAINLVGLQPLKDKLLSIKSLSEEGVGAEKIYEFELIRSRIYVASHLTQYWADYMGQTSSEEMYCASMLTGINDLNSCLSGQSLNDISMLDLDAIDSIQPLYHFSDHDIGLLPDSIQQFHESSSISERLKLSIIVYHLVSCVEFGYECESFENALNNICEYVGIGIHRAGYDFSRQVVEIDKDASHQRLHHCHFLLSTNTEFVNPLTA
ncbi:MAG: HDOD domain-containing protein [Gammaproteobacteria bacterium]|nr:HDOD domain-containing protein [Gammaproteobacteria bacterium]